MAKERFITFSDVFADTVLTAMLRTGYESNKFPYRIKEGLPEDAKLVDVKLIEGMMPMLYMRFYSETFEDVPDPDALPSLYIFSERLK